MPPPKQHKTIPAAAARAPERMDPPRRPLGTSLVLRTGRPARPCPRTAKPTPCDAFLADRQKKEGVSWSAEAPKSVLIRRVALDVTGLPPTPAEVSSARRGSACGRGRLLPRQARLRRNTGPASGSTWPAMPTAAAMPLRPRPHDLGLP
jgi:hypothetical protein